MIENRIPAGTQRDLILGAKEKGMASQRARMHLQAG